jgi:hypothetical protein
MQLRGPFALQGNMVGTRRPDAESVSGRLKNEKPKDGSGQQEQSPDGGPGLWQRLARSGVLDVRTAGQFVNRLGLRRWKLHS